MALKSPKIGNTYILKNIPIGSVVQMDSQLWLKCPVVLVRLHGPQAGTGLFYPAITKVQLKSLPCPMVSAG